MRYVSMRNAKQIMPLSEKVNREKPGTHNLVSLCWAAGFPGVSGLARHINRNRVTVWRAVRWPDQFGPTYRAILEALYDTTKN